MGREQARRESVLYFPSKLGRVNNVNRGEMEEGQVE